jgi:hypothetical protein
MSKLFAKNEGMADRVVRTVAGVALIGGAAMGPLAPWGWIGVVPLATGLLGRCPAYGLLGMSTCPMKESTAAKG